MAKDLKKASPPTGPQAHVLHDPIVVWWERWRKTIVTGLLVLVGAFIAVELFGRFQRSSEAEESEQIARVVKANSVDEAVSQAGLVDDGDAQLTAKIAAFQKSVMAFSGDFAGDDREALERARVLGQEVADRGTVGGKMLSEGISALTGQESAELVAPLKAVKQTLESGELAKAMEPPTVEGAPRVLLEIALSDEDKMTLELAIFADHAPDVAKAFLEEVQAGSFDLLYWYTGSAGGASVLRFGDPRASVKIEDDYLPPKTNWGNGVNRKPVAWKRSQIAPREGRVVAWVDDRTGEVNAREIAIFSEKMDPKATVGNMQHVVFGELVLASGEELEAKLEPLAEKAKSTEEGAFRPFLLKATMKTDGQKPAEGEGKDG